VRSNGARYAPGQHGQKNGAALVRLRRTAAREAEGAADLWCSRAAVPRVSRRRTGVVGMTGENLLQLLEVASGQRRLPHGFRRIAHGSAQVVRHNGDAGQRQAREHPVVSRCVRATWSRSASKAKAHLRIKAAAAAAESARFSGMGRGRREGAPREPTRPSRERSELPPTINEVWSSSCTRSNRRQWLEGITAKDCTCKACGLS
jgi:hypothetical protein